MSEKILESGSHSVGDATILVELVEYQYAWMNEARTVLRWDVPGDTDVEMMNEVRKVLEALNLADEEVVVSLGGLRYDTEQLVYVFEEMAQEFAEELEVPFIYTRDARIREYTPRSMWEPSGGCEWEESASEYDYGWDL